VTQRAHGRQRHFQRDSGRQLDDEQCRLAGRARLAGDPQRRQFETGPQPDAMFGRDRSRCTAATFEGDDLGEVELHFAKLGAAHDRLLSFVHCKDADQRSVVDRVRGARHAVLGLRHRDEHDRGGGQQRRRRKTADDAEHVHFAGALPSFL
jgi:hypothetical protein